MTPADLVTRFAPSPTGLLHQGHALSALSAFDAAEAASGRFLLRIEDIDATRTRLEFEQAIHRDLAWLGVRWETPVRRQSEHPMDYTAALDRLRGAACCIAVSAPAGDGRDHHLRPARAPGWRAVPGRTPPPDEEAKRLAAGQTFAWHLSLDAARAALGQDWDRLAFVEEGAGPAGETGLIPARPERLGDVILARKDVGVAYHLAVVVDDALQGVSHVIRGEDLFEAAHVQRLLQALLGLPAPIYRHHRLLLGPDGKRLAKRNGAQSLASLREGGATPSQVRESVGL